MTQVTKDLSIKVMLGNRDHDLLLRAAANRRMEPKRLAYELLINALIDEKKQMETHGVFESPKGRYNRLS